MRTKLSLIADLSERLAECRYHLGVLSGRPAAGMSLAQTSELIGHIRHGRTEDAVAVLRQCFRLSNDDAALVLGGGTYHAAPRPP